MLLTMARWDAIREQFTEEEKKELNAAITGETLCPKGAVLDESLLRAELAEKIKAAK